MAPSSPTAAEPVRASARKRAVEAVAEQIHQDREEEELAPASNKRICRGSSSGGKKTKPPKKKTKSPPKKKTKPPPKEDDDVCAEEPDEEEIALAEAAEAEEQEILLQQQQEGAAAPPPENVGRKRLAQSHASSSDENDPEFVGDPIPATEARAKWPNRYSRGAVANRPNEEDDVKAKCHYTSAKVDNVIYNLEDDVYVKAADNEKDYIGRITEFFEGTDHRRYFTCRWFFRPEDTVIDTLVTVNIGGHKHDPKRVFLSDERNDNVLDCIVAKVHIIHVDPNMDPNAKAQQIKDADLYYDMSYSVAYSTFANIPPENGMSGSETASAISSEGMDLETSTPARTATLLDLYSGCGGMSTGLCLGGALAGLKLETRWAVDLNRYACQSLKYNHPQTEVRNEKADEFLALLKEWAVLCDKYTHEVVGSELASSTAEEDDGSSSDLDDDEFVVEKLIGICYGGEGRDNGVYFKVKWQGYGPEYDTWEPIENLCECPLKIREFVQEGYRKRILPLPGDVDVICGGPPCQGISGFNRFRNRKNPLNDEKNMQMVTFMDIVAYLKPKYVLMENVVDILKFADGYLGRFALSCLVAMNYQARLGIVIAGCYGLPQFRMRVFLWGALPSKVLPKYPLPTHNVVVRGGVPNAFSQSVVAYDETQKATLKKALFLGDAISDLPSVENYQPCDVMDYGAPPETEFQRYIRLSRRDMLDHSFGEAAGPDEGKLLDHQPLRLNVDDHQRVQQIPIKKGANFRDLKGVRVGEKNTVEWDPDVPRVRLPSGKPLVPDYAMSFIKGRSSKPFGRLWWDETVPTVVTRAEPHNQIILHPEQARVLTVRENARLQGFPDYYRLFGPIKEKYIQVGNAVAVPVARALGCCLGQAYLGESDGSDPVCMLPASFTSLGQPTTRASSVSLPLGEVDEQ